MLVFCLRERATSRDTELNVLGDFPVFYSGDGDPGQRDCDLSRQSAVERFGQRGMGRTLNDISERTCEKAYEGSIEEEGTAKPLSRGHRLVAGAPSKANPWQ